MKTDVKLDKLANIIKDPPVNLSSYGVAFTGWMNDKGEVHHSTNTACHAGLNSGENGKRELRQVDFVWSKMVSEGVNADKTQRDMFINYMLTESPWASLFLNENVDEVLTYGWLISADTDAHLLVNAMVATRLVSEFTNSRFQFFIKAIDNGMSKNMAMVLSMFCSHSDNSFYISECTGHGFTYDVNKKIIPNFINNTPVLYRGPYREVLSYNRHCNVWDGSKEGWGRDGLTTEVLNTIPIYKVVDKVNLNIFFKEKRRTSYTYHDYSTSKYFEKQVKEKFIA
jgi:hypothetical protein